MVDVLIAFEQTPGPRERQMVRGHGGLVRRSFWLVPAVAASVPEHALPALAQARGVALIEPDRERHLIEPLVHNLPDGADPDLGVELNESWGVKHIGAGWVHEGYDPVLDIAMPANVGTNVGLAVLDTGVDTSSDTDGLMDYEFSHNYAGGYDFYNDDVDPYDDHYHGTHVSGIAAAERNGVFVVGAAPGVHLYACKMLGETGSGSISDVVAALEACVEHNMAIAGVPGAQTLPAPPVGGPGFHVPICVINCSFGGRHGSDIEEAAFDNSYAAGILQVAAAGNSGRPGGKGNNVTYPAAYTSVIGVAATDQDDLRAVFSSTGPAVELSAPGVDIRSTLPDEGGAYLSGTSMASPHVAGVAALVFAANPECDNVAVRNILAATAIPLGDPDQYGFGRVHAVGAVLAVCEATPPPPGGSGAVTVDSISYSSHGGKTQDNHLQVTVAVVDGSEPVAGASVAVTLTLFDEADMEVDSWSATEITDGAGEVSLTLNNAPGGCYRATVIDVGANGMTWDGLTPENEFCK
jgi:subtilisin family serine protease